MTWVRVSLPGLSSTGFIRASGSMPAASACMAWARPISAPSGVTKELSDMFWALNGATRTPCRASQRHSPAVSTLFPASEVVPATSSPPLTGGPRPFGGDHPWRETPPPRPTNLRAPGPPGRLSWVHELASGRRRGHQPGSALCPTRDLDHAQ